MKLRDFNKKLKKEYFDNFKNDELSIKSNKPKSSVSLFKKILLISVSVFVCFCIVQHVAIAIYNSNKMNETLEVFNNEGNDLYEIESNKDFKKQMSVRNFTEKKSILSSIFSINIGCSTKYLGGAPNSDFNNSINTNVQTEGVDEADTAKCDGEYVYSILYGKPFISSLDNSILITGEFITSNLYIYDDKIIYICVDSIKICAIDGNKLDIIKDIPISDLLDSRLVDNMLYFIDRAYMKNEDLTGYYYDGSRNANYVFHMYKLDLNSLDIKLINIVSNKNVILYASNNNFYLASTIEFDSIIKTYISIIDYELNEVGVIRVDGSINNQFSLDEYNGYLRVVTTNELKNNYELNALYIYSLDDLKLTGSITEGIGIERQTIKSVTFKGDVCYAVTYLNIDPLFEIDCSDPYNPVIVSQYQSPGYSSYLKTFEIDDNLYTLGIGYNDYGDIKMSVYEQFENGTYQIGRDLLFCSYVQDSYENYHIVNSYPWNLLNYKALFIHSDSQYFYVGAMVDYNLYTIFKIDVSNDINPIEPYLEIIVNTDYNNARGFLVDGIFYIPTTSGLKTIEWN